MTNLTTCPRCYEPTSTPDHRCPDGRHNGAMLRATVETTTCPTCGGNLLKDGMHRARAFARLCAVLSMPKRTR